MQLLAEPLWMLENCAHCIRFRLFPQPAKADLFSLRKAVLKVIRFEPAVCIEKANSLISLSDCHQTAQTAWRIAVVPMCAIEAQMANTCLVEPVLREAIRNEYMVSAYGLSLYRRYAAFK